MSGTLVTGADGLLGSALQGLSNQNFLFVGRSDCNLEDYESVRSLIGDYRPDSVVHAAAIVGGVAANANHPATFFSSNLRQNLNVIDASREFGVSRLLAFASTCAFPDKADYPLDQRSLHNGEPHVSNFGYAYAKRMVEVQIRSTNKEFGTFYRTVIPANLYGPHDNFDLASGHVIPALIHKAHLAKESGADFVVWGSGTPLREFVYSHDLARAVPHLLDGKSTDPLIFSHGQEVSIAQIAGLIAEEFGIKPQLVFDSSQTDGQLRKPSNFEPLIEELPHFQFTEPAVGLRETISWFKSNYPVVRGVHVD
jgi:GDP-L-fucose synthase